MKFLYIFIVIKLIKQIFSPILRDGRHVFCKFSTNHENFNSETFGFLTNVYILCVYVPLNCGINIVGINLACVADDNKLIPKSRSHPIRGCGRGQNEIFTEIESLGKFIYLH